MDFQFGNATGVETISELELTKDAMGTTVQLELDVSQGLEFGGDWIWWHKLKTNNCVVLV